MNRMKDYRNLSLGIGVAFSESLTYHWGSSQAGGWTLSPDASVSHGASRPLTLQAFRGKEVGKSSPSLFPGEGSPAKGLLGFAV